MIRREAPDLLVFKYWTPFMAPCFGRIARLARRNGRTRTVCQIDNVIPHEHHFFDKMLTRYFVDSMDGFVYMSHEVGRDLAQFTTGQKCVYSPHPLFENLGARLERGEACNRMGLNPEVRYMLFFGLIRDYKGLDMLLEAWSRLKTEGKTEGRRLIVAGEFYTAPEPYRKLIDEEGIADEVILHDRFIPDSVVGDYFSVADFVVLPYRSATQSGVTQIAYQFSTPMIVTDVGGLKEIVPDGKVGYLCQPNPESIAEKVEQIWQGDNLDRFYQNCLTERERFSWEEMCAKLMAVYDRVK
jgi:glycosyltransferase involved in cell wall biosynthesis